MNVALITSQFDELKSNYPKLELEKNQSFSIVGFLEFAACIDGSDEIIEDGFEIQINIPHTYPESIPTVKEIGNRIPDKFHQFMNGHLCLGAPLGIKKIFLQNSTLLHFVNKSLIPYLYSYSYFEKFGEMPFGELSHGSEGILQFYQELFRLDNQEKALRLLEILAFDCYKGHEKCPCESNRRLRKCHGPQLLSIKNLQTVEEFRKEYLGVKDFIEFKKNQTQMLIKAILGK